MELDDLRTAQNNERRSEKLQELPDSFYEDAAEYIEDLREERDSFDDPYSDEAQRVNDEVESARRVAESIYERRVGKVVKMASLAANGHSADEDNMTREEREMYENVVSEIRDNYDHVVGVLEGETTGTRTSDADETRTQDGNDGTTARDDGYATVRAKESLPEFVGTDGREYSLGEEDVARIPEENARALEDSGAAVEIDL